MDEVTKNRYKKFGNNYFTLKAPGKDPVCGVLTEIPSFSFSTTWNDSPQAAMGAKLLEVVNKPEIEFLATQANGAKPMRRVGNLTAKVYENAEPVSFELKFRCYPGQPFGGDSKLSSVADWIDTLKDSIISEETQIKIDNVLETFKNAVHGGSTAVMGIIDDVKELFKEYNENETGVDAEGNRRIGNIRKINARRRMESLGKKILQRNVWRVEKSIENYGAAIYELRLFPFVFYMPFNVYISSWSVKPSKEFNMKEDTNYYFDFTISCEMDQIPDANNWNNNIFAWPKENL